MNPKRQNRIVRLLVGWDVRRQQGMTRREYRQFIDECHNSEPWYEEPGTYASNSTYIVGEKGPELWT